MVDTQVSEACSARCEGSSPSLGTNNFPREVLEPSLCSGWLNLPFKANFPLLGHQITMKKVFIIHGFEGSPNGWWRPWLMGELEKRDIYACALPMPTPENPICAEWVHEIERHVVQNKTDEIYLVGHSLGGPAILRFLENTNGISVHGTILVSSPAEKNTNKKIDSFLEKNFDFNAIKESSKQFVVIHGDNDPLVPLRQAQYLHQQLGGELIVVKDGGHLNGSSGCFVLPECLRALERLFSS